jgi:ribosomal protein S18 acetylase RimI-like enzyme
VTALVRAATPDDLGALEPILPAFLAPPYKRGRFLRALSNGEVCVAHVDGGIVGFMWLTEFFGHRFVNVLAVASHERRNGHAGVLLAAAEANLPTDRIFTSTNRSNTPMHALLARYGWSRCGEVDQLDPGDPEVFYVKRPALSP